MNGAFLASFDEKLLLYLNKSPLLTRNGETTMKAIFNGKRYDTDKAILIGEADALSFGVSSTRDFHWWEASLYRTPRSGAYFLAGRGGPMTRWARPAGNMTTGGSGIHPMDRDEALEWAEQYLSADEIEKGFAEIVDA